ncbi:hypothetical protein [Sporosarcina ureae]
MKTSWNIFKLDLKHIGKNWVAALLIGGLTILPSLCLAKYIRNMGSLWPH